MKYTIDYFIEKFEAIPEENWHINDYTNKLNTDQHCALGHCGEDEFNQTEESKTLYKISNEIINANDGLGKWINDKSSPKERVINYLKSLKDLR